MKKFKSAEQYLIYLNEEYHKLHKRYEDLFWIYYMGDHSLDKQMNQALKARDTFRSDPKYTTEIERLYSQASKKERDRLELWLYFFSFYQTPSEALKVKEKINNLES